MKLSNGDHALRLLNRTEHMDPANPEQWNEGAVYIDPWRSLISYGHELSRHNRNDCFGRGSLKCHFTMEQRLDA